MFYNMTVKQHSAYCLYLLFLSFCQTGLFVGHCQHCRSKKTRGFILLCLTTIVTMIDNFYNIHDCNI